MARKNQYPEKIITDTHASCSKCKSMKLHSEFSSSKNSPGGLCYWCKSCSSENAKTNHRKRVLSGDTSYIRGKRNTAIKRKYGITIDQYEDKLVLQNSICSICKIPLLSYGQHTHLDHNHTTGKLRDFLCTNCNRGLGHFKDKKELLMEAAKYLERHTENGTQKEGRCL
jgi:hypothetical protein